MILSVPKKQMKKNNTPQVDDFIKAKLLIDAFHKEFLTTKNAVLFCDRLAQFNKKSTKFVIIPGGFSIIQKKHFHQHFPS